VELHLTTGRLPASRFADIPAHSCRPSRQLCAARTLRCCKGEFHERRRTSCQVDRYWLGHSVPLASGAFYIRQSSSRASHFVVFHRSSIRSLHCNVGTTFAPPSRQNVALGYCRVTFAQTCFISDLSHCSPDARWKAISKHYFTPT
jgi:hypothetical protein